MTRPKASPEQVALYRAIVAHPQEDTPRLVYADWLDENGDATDRAHAELIRNEHQRWHMNTWDEGYTAARIRGWRLWREIGDRWRTAPGEPERADTFPTDLITYNRGFAGTVTFFLKDVTPEQARDWFACRPITWAEYHFDASRKDVGELWQLTTDTMPSLRGVCLNLDQFCPPKVRPTVIRVLAGAECRSGLKRLEIHSPLSLADLKVVLASAHLKRLEAFSLSGREVVDAHAVLLAEKMDFPALRELSISISRPEEEDRRRNSSAKPSGRVPPGLKAIGRAEWLAKLSTFRLVGYDDITPEGLEILLGSQPLPELRTLQISEFAGLSAAIARLMGGTGLPGVRNLTLGGYLRYKDWPTLGAGPQELLSFTAGDSSDSDDPKGIFDGPAFRSLRRLTALGGTRHVNFATELARSQLTQTLRSLMFSGEFRTDTTAPLLSAREWPNLEYLFLDNATPWKTLIALIESDKFPRLIGLKARCHEQMSVFLKRLAKCPAVARFRELELGGDLTPAALKALADSPYLDGVERLALETRGTAKPEDRQRLVDRLGSRVEFALNQGRA